MPINLFDSLANLFIGGGGRIDEKIISAIRKEFDRHNYVFFDNDSRPWNLNIIGLRRLPKTDWNIFDDTQLIVCRDDYGAWRFFSFPITTMPGTSILQNPVNSKGTAILKAGQYRGMWEKGLHKGEYPALVQKGPVTVLRYKDGKIVMEDAGYFGINCHKAGIHSLQVNGYSAGCQVHQLKVTYDCFIYFIDLAVKYWGNSFTYTLLELK